MEKITTLTLNPALDATTSIDEVKPDKKLRCDAPRRYPGGGGVNVARAIKRLGGQAEAIYIKGGVIGELFEELVTREDVPQNPFEVADTTRENLIVKEESTGSVFRFNTPGARLTEEEFERLMDKLQALRPGGYLVASGSLPPGVPDSAYARMAELAVEKDLKFILDTSGPPLKAALEAGVYLLKPNLEELGDLTDRNLDNRENQKEALSQLIADYEVEAIVLSLGAEGVLWATREGVKHVAAPELEAENAVGAGDSTVAGIVWKLASGESIESAVRFGVACGAAAILTPGTELLRREDAEQLFEKVLELNG